MDEGSPWFIGGLPDKVQNATSRNSVPLVPSGNLYATLPLCSLSQSRSSLLHSLAAMRNRNDSLWQSPAQMGKLSVHSPALPFPRGRNHGEIPWAVLFSPKLRCPRGRGRVTLAVLLLLVLPLCVPTFLLLLQRGVELLLWKPGLSQGCLITGDTQVSVRRHSRALVTGATLQHSPQQLPLLLPKSVCLSPGAPLGRAPPRSLCVGLGPTTPTEALASWADGKFLLLEVRQTRDVIMLPACCHHSHVTSTQGLFQSLNDSLL